MTGSAFAQISKIPGAQTQNINVQSCNNPTFDSNGDNLLADSDPMPPACDQQGPTQCSAGTGGASNTVTAVKPSAAVAGTGAVDPVGTNPNATPAATRGTTSGTSRTSTGAVASSGSSSGGSNGGGGASAVAGTSGSSGGVTPPALGGASSAAAASCDPTAGNCSSADVATGTPNGASSSGGGVAADVASSLAATPLTLATTKGWSGTQTLMVIVGLLVLAVVLAPGLTSRYLRGPRR